MNRINDYETLLELANDDLKKYNVELRLSECDGDYSLEILTKNEDGSVETEAYAGGYYEDELSNLIHDAWSDAQKKAMRAKKNERLPKLNKTLRLFCESVQEITLQAWPVIYADNKYDQDSREVLDTIREWAWEFENWWLSHDQKYIGTHDYLDEIWDFTARKCKEYLKELGVLPEPEQKSWVVNIERTEIYSMDVRVNATTKEGAEAKVERIWNEDDGCWFYDHLTENATDIKQTYEARTATPDDPDSLVQL